MRIAIDLDGVVFNSEMYFMASAEIYDAKILHRNSLKKAGEPRIQEKYDWNEEEIKGYIARFANSTDFDIIPCAKEVIDELKKDNTVAVVSARGQFNEDEIKIARDKLDKANITFDEYFFGNLNKIETYLDKKMDIIIDDRYDVILKASENHIRSIYFYMAGRKILEESKYIKVVNNWGEIYRYLYDLGVIKNEED